MRKRVLLAIVLVVLASIVASAQTDCDEWFTSNETAVPGDWDGTLLLRPDDAVTRTALHAVTGTYSYKHYVGTSSPALSAATYIECSNDLTSGEFSGWMMADSTNWPPGHAGDDDKEVFTIGEFVLGSWIEAWEITYSSWEDAMIFFCGSCVEDIHGHLGLVFPDTWQSFRVVWDLPADPGTGSVQVWMDNHLYLDLDGLDMLGPAESEYSDADTLIAGPYYWSYAWNTGRAVYIDDVWINPPEDEEDAVVSFSCGQYGHSAVVNVDADCNGIIRFEFPTDLPRDADIDQAMLNLYVVALEPYAQTLYWTYLVPLWGEMTTDWCRRTVGDLWTEPGASNIPGDRAPGVYGTFRVSEEGSWMQIPLDPDVVEAWNADREADPGITIFNPNATGRVSFASREWYDATADYRPRLDLWYSD